MSYAFAETIRRQMEAKNLQSRALADKVGWSFEHIRKLCNSEAFPSAPLQKALANALEIDAAELEKQVNADRWRKKYGRIPATASEARHPISAVWEDLSKDQQTLLLCVARCMARQKKRKAA